MSDYMHPKMWCMWKPAQSGKTRSMQEWIRDNEETAEHLNILITANNRLLVSQLTRRMIDDGFGTSDSSGSDSDGDDDMEVSDDHIDEVSKVFSWMSGTKKTFISAGDLADYVKEDKVTMVCCCAHKVRFKYIIALLERLEKSKNFHKRISIWIDEADASVKMWAKTFNFTSFTRVDRVVLVSATFEKVFNYYKFIRVRGYETVYNAPTYLRYGECNIVVEDNLDLTKMLEKYPEMSAPGIKLFAPGKIDVASHDIIVDLLCSRGFAVMVLNGRRKEIVLPDGEKIPIVLKSNANSSPDEIGRVLADIYMKKTLSRFPFAVTGQICLGRGITFQSKDFMFNYGVIPDLRDVSETYQCVARVLGNTKEFPEFARPTIYCSYSTDKACKYLAHVAENIARIAYERGLPDFSRNDIESCLGQMEPKKFITPEQKERDEIVAMQNANVRLEEFHSMQALHDRFREILREHPELKWSGRLPNEPNRNKDNKYTCSISRSAGVQTTDNIRKFAVGGMRSWGSAATTSKRGDFIRRVYAGYDGEVATLFLRWTYSV